MTPNLQRSTSDQLRFKRMDGVTDIVTRISNGAFVSLLGKWVPSHGGKQRSELQVEKVLMVGEGDTLVG